MNRVLVMIYRIFVIYSKKIVGWVERNPTYIRMLGYAKPPPNLRLMHYFKLATPLV